MTKVVSQQATADPDDETDPCSPLYSPSAADMPRICSTPKVKKRKQAPFSSLSNLLALGGFLYSGRLLSR